MSVVPSEPHQLHLATPSIANMILAFDRTNSAADDTLTTNLAPVTATTVLACLCCCADVKLVPFIVVYQLEYLEANFPLL